MLADDSVSRYHATLELFPGQVRVQDKGSRNGTFFLSARVTEARVPFGGTIRVGRTTLRFRPKAPTALPASTAERLGHLVGRSLPMRQLFAVIERVAASDISVVITGETGTGKEEVARAIHALSPRAAAPLCAFDCAAAREALIESELFGHKRGAFTGADRDRVGVLAEAGQGTLLLDQVTELPLELQARLLRVLERRASRRWAGRTHSSSGRECWRRVERDPPPRYRRGGSGRTSTSASPPPR